MEGTVPPSYLIQRARDQAHDAIKRVSAELGATYAGKPARAPEGLGDFAFACHPLAQALRSAPGDIAQRVAASLGAQSAMTFAAAGPYVNVAIAPERLVNEGLREALEAGERFGELPATGRRVLVEHTSANPNGPLHVGRARNPIIGDSVVRLMRKAGNKTEAEFFVNDIGKQLVILAWGVLHLDDAALAALPERLRQLGAPEEEIKPLMGPGEDEVVRDKVDHKLVRFYQAASALAKHDPAVDKQIMDDVRLIENGDKHALARVHGACNRVLDGMKVSLARLNAHFDRFSYESAFITSGAVHDVVRRLKESKDAREDGGAWYLDLEPYGIAGRTARYVLVRADGTTLYATRDVAYHLDKAQRCDRCVNVLGEDQKLAAKQVEIALGVLGSPWKPDPLFYAFVALPEGKMSTRRGRVVSIDDLLDESVARAREEVQRRREDLDEAQKIRISEAVGVGAVRFNIVRVQPEKAITFRWEEALNFEGNSAPFIQYSHARACSILRKAKADELITRPSHALAGLGNGALIANDAPSMRLVRAIARLPLVVEESAAAVRPHVIAGYAQELASTFNDFYRDSLVVGSGEAEAPRLALVAAGRAALSSALNLLGVEALVEM